LSVTFLVIIVLLLLVLTILGYDAWVKRTKKKGKEPQIKKAKPDANA